MNDALLLDLWRYCAGHFAWTVETFGADAEARALMDRVSAAVGEPPFDWNSRQLWF